MIWGINDNDKSIIGTSFKPFELKVGNENLMNWLLRLLEPNIDFNFHEINVDGKKVILLEIPPARIYPVRFNGTEYIRVGEHKKKLKDLPEKERALWRTFDAVPFEKQIAAFDLSETEVLHLLDYAGYFDLLKLPFPENRSGILESLENDEMIKRQENGRFSITYLGAVLLAKDLTQFDPLKRKTLRIIQYDGNTKLQTVREIEIKKGYAVGFEEIIQTIHHLVPVRETIGEAFRETKHDYPDVAIRELVANALIHQDFFQRGNSVMIEIFDNRMEITNPGTPLVDTERFLDTPPRSRNEILAAFMRRINICEERGSGIDKAVAATEQHQLPAPVFREAGDSTIAILFAPKHLKDMNKQDRIWATYLHASLRYIQNDFMTNTSLRERFGIDERNRAMVSRIIKEAIQAGKIRIYDESVGTKARQYVPWWA